MGLDGVEILMRWEEAFDISISDAEATSIRTPADGIQLVAKKVGATRAISGPCLSMRAFHRLRKAITECCNVRYDQIRPTTRVRQLVIEDRRATWNRIRVAADVEALPHPDWFGPRTMEDFAQWIVVHAIPRIKPANEPWTVSQIRCVVRTAVTDVTGAKDFADSDDFIRDIGID